MKVSALLILFFFIGKGYAYDDKNVDGLIQNFVFALKDDNLEIRLVRSLDERRPSSFIQNGVDLIPYEEFLLKGGQLNLFRQIDSVKGAEAGLLLHPRSLSDSQNHEELIYGLGSSSFAPPHESEWVLVSSSVLEVEGNVSILVLPSYNDRMVPAAHTEELGFNGKDLFEDMKLIYLALQDNKLSFGTVTSLKTSLGEHVILSILNPK